MTHERSTVSIELSTTTGGDSPTIYNSIAGFIMYDLNDHTDYNNCSRILSGGTGYCLGESRYAR